MLCYFVIKNFLQKNYYYYYYYFIFSQKKL